MSSNSDKVMVYAHRRWPWWRIVVASIAGLTVFVAFVAVACIAYKDPNVVRIYLNDTFVRAQAVVLGLVVAPYLLLLQLMVTLQAIGRWPVLVLFERDGVRFVASWLGSHRLSKYRLALRSKGAVKVLSIAGDPFKRQLVDVRAGGDRLRVQSYGDISDQDLAIVEAWVSRREKA